MTARERAIAAIGGFSAGLAGGFFGVGGGTILVPFLTGPLGLSQHRAHGTSLAVIGATAVISLVVYVLHGNVAWIDAAIIAPASFVTARYGARLAAKTPSPVLARVFSVFLLIVAIRLFWTASAPPSAIVPQGLPTALFDVALGLVAGLLAGYMGVGGGIVVVPALTLLAGISQAVAQGTSLAVILLAAPAGAIEHHRHGNLALRLVPMLALGAAIGAPLSSLAAQRLSHELLTRSFAAFLLVNAVSGWIRVGTWRGRAAGQVPRS